MSTNETHRKEGIGTSDHLETDAVIEVLSDDVRRRIVRELDRHESISRDRLAGRLAREFGKDPRTLAIQIAHNHGPKLEDFDVLEIDGAMVRPAKNYPVVRRYLSHLD